MRYLLDHTVLMDRDWWHVLALVVLLVVATVFWKKLKAMKEETEELEEQLSNLESEKVPDQEDLSFMNDSTPRHPKAKKLKSKGGRFSAAFHYHVTL